MRFSWSGLGKPDYSQCHKIVGSLPRDLRDELTKSDREGLVRSLHMLWVGAFRSGRQKAYAYFSERWLGEAIGMSYRTAQRVVAHLRDLDLLKVINRRPENDTWQTNLYEPGKRLLAILFGGFRGKSPKKSAYAIFGAQDPEEGDMSPSDGSHIRPEEDSLPSIAPIADTPLEGVSTLAEAGKRVESGVAKLSDLIAAIRPAIHREAEARKANSEAHLQQYWKKAGVLPVGS